MKATHLANSHHCLGVVLAGGLSSRMGQDKAQLLRDNDSMLNFSKQLLTDTGINHVVISGNAHQIPDLIDNAGPVGGIYSVIQQYQPKAMLILPVDLPLMTVTALAKLKQIGELSQQACYYQGHSIPLYLPNSSYLELFLTKAFQDYNSNRLSKNNIKGPSMKALLKQVPHQSLIIENNQLLLNTNTPEQWQQAQQTLKSNLLKQNNKYSG